MAIVWKCHKSIYIDTDTSSVLFTVDYQPFKFPLDIRQWNDTSLYLALSLCIISHVVWCILRWRKDKYKEWLHYIYLLNHTRNTLYQSSE